MKKFLIFLLVSVFFTGFTFSKNLKVEGDWLLIKVKIDGKVSEPNIPVKFTSEGKLIFMGREIGKWKLTENERSLIVNSPISKSLNGKSEVLKVDSKSLILRKDGSTYYYSRIDKNRLIKENEKSGLCGLWKIEEKGSEKYIKLSLPSDVKIVELNDNSIDEYSGEWFYAPEDNSIVFIVITSPLKGKNKVVELGKDNFVFSKNGKIIKTKRVKTEDSKIIKLNFKYEDFDENSDFHNLLPWNDFEKMLEFTKTIKSVKYKRGVYINELGIFKYREIISEVNSYPSKNRVVFTNSYILKGKREQFSEISKDELSERFNYFFPEKELSPYRVLGKETLKLKSEMYKCTVVEGFDGERKVKYWMIDSMPGIFARKVAVFVNPFGKATYTLTELLSVEKK